MELGKSSRLVALITNNGLFRRDHIITTFSGYYRVGYECLHGYGNGLV
jgi:hypothetical protein